MWRSAESRLERDHVMALDFGRAVPGVSSQPFTLPWGGPGRRVSHTPDYFARMARRNALMAAMESSCVVIV